MSKITFKQIDKILSKAKYGESITIPYGDFSVDVKTTLTAAEKKVFVDSVVENSYISKSKAEDLGFDDFDLPIDEKDLVFSSTKSRIAFLIVFAQMFTNIPLPMEKDSEVINCDKLKNIVYGLDVIENAIFTSKTFDNTLTELEDCIKEEVDFKNQKIFAACAASACSNEAIETVALLANTALNGVNKICDILDGVKELSKDGNFLESVLESVSEGGKIKPFIDKLQILAGDASAEQD